MILMEVFKMETGIEEGHLLTPRRDNWYLVVFAETDWEKQRGGDMVTEPAAFVFHAPIDGDHEIALLQHLHDRGSADVTQLQWINYLHLHPHRETVVLNSWGLEREEGARGEKR